LLSLLGIITFFLAKPLVEKKGKPFDTAFAMLSFLRG